MSGVTGPALGQLANALAAALGPGWGCIDTTPAADPDMVTTRVGIVNQRHDWWLSLTTSGAPDQPGWVTIHVDDHIGAHAHDRINWAALPPGSGRLAMNSEDPPETLAAMVKEHLLTYKARARQHELREAAAKVSAEQARIDGTRQALAFCIEDSISGNTRETTFAHATREAGTIAPKVLYDPDDGELRVAGLQGYHMEVTGPDRVSITMRKRTVSPNTAALIALLLNCDRKLNE